MRNFSFLGYFSKAEEAFLRLSIFRWLKSHPEVFFGGVALFLFLLSLWLRWPRVTAPFWVDEFSTARQAQLLVDEGSNALALRGEALDYHNFTTHALVGMALWLGGHSEWWARFPIVLLGAFLSVCVWFALGRIQSLSRLALPTAFLVAIFYPFLAWSQQARGYMLQQVLAWLAFAIVLEVHASEKMKFNRIIALFIILCLGVLTHGSFLLVASITVASLIWFSRAKLFSSLLVLSVAAISVFIVSWFLGLPQRIVLVLLEILQSGLANNFRYYHAFLWRTYPLITILGVVGLGSLLLQKKRVSQVAASFALSLIGLYLFFFSFLFSPYNSRYILLIFPFLLLGVAETISVLYDHFLTLLFTAPSKVPALLKNFGFVAIFLLLALNGHHFVLWPQAYYSVNHDVREIARIDYDQVFARITQKTETLSPEEYVVIDTWVDRPRWYLGNEGLHLGVFRWMNEQSSSNGIPHRTDFETDETGQKYVDNLGKFWFVGELSDLRRLQEQYPYGFLFIDDSSLPRDVIEYAEKHLFTELKIESYGPELQENPYSIWPATLYSWGFEEHQSYATSSGSQE